MIYYNKFNDNIDFINRKNGWEWRYDSDESKTEGVIYFKPFKDSANHNIWLFNADENEDPATHNEYQWDQEQPWLEYNAETVSQWNDEHPNNLTRYLSSFAGIGSVIASVKNVYIDTKPPKLKEWDKKSFVTINSNVKKVSLTVTEDSGIDIGCYTIKQKDGTILYRKSRKAR